MSRATFASRNERYGKVDVFIGPGSRHSVQHRKAEGHAEDDVLVGKSSVCARTKMPSPSHLQEQGLLPSPPPLTFYWSDSSIT